MLRSQYDPPRFHSLDLPDRRGAVPCRRSLRAQKLPIAKPRRLKAGDTVALVSPASATFETVDLDIARESLEEVFNDHVRLLKIPAWQGPMIGHRIPQFTIAQGLQVEIDARAGTIRMLEVAVN